MPLLSQSGNPSRTFPVPADSSPEYGGSVQEFIVPFGTPIEGTYAGNPFREPDDFVWRPNFDTQLADLDFDGTGKGNSEGGFGVRDGASIGLDFIPLISSGKGGVELITGWDYIANQPVSRWMAAAGILAGIFGAKGLLKAGAKASSAGGDVVRVFNFTDKGVDLNRAAGPRTSGGFGGTHTTFDDLSNPNVLPVFQDGVIPPPIRSGVVTEIEVPRIGLLPDPTTGNFGHGTQWIAPKTPGAKIVNEWDAMLDEENWVFEIIPRK